MLRSIEASASALDVSHWTIRGWVRQGLIKTVKLGSRRMVPVEELERIAEHGLKPARPQTVPGDRVMGRLNRTKGPAE